jgi:hypothetical protein
MLTEFLGCHRLPKPPFIVNIWPERQGARPEHEFATDNERIPRGSRMSHHKLAISDVEGAVVYKPSQIATYIEYPEM